MSPDFQSVLVFPVSFSEFLANILIAFVCGVVISIIYRKTYQGPDYSITFANATVLLAMITAIVIMVIGNNLARAFGLVGAMSIIRFRTAVKDTQDIVIIFFALTIGMAAGVGLHAIAIGGTIIIGLILWGLSVSKFGIPRRREFLLQFRFDADEDAETPYVPVIERYCRKYKVVNVKALNGALLEISYYVNVKDANRAEKLVRELGKVQGVQQVNLFFDEEQY